VSQVAFVIELCMYQLKGKALEVKCFGQIYLLTLFVNFSVSYEHSWNVTISNLSSTTVNVSWLPLNSSSLNSTDIYGYVAVCLHSVSSDILLLSVENALSSNTMVRNLKSYRKYKVKVVAILKDRVTGVITLKSSEETDIHTKEGGK